jgi:hypothetical protein
MTDLLLQIFAVLAMIGCIAIISAGFFSGNKISL